MVTRTMKAFFVTLLSALLGISLAMECRTLQLRSVLLCLSDVINGVNGSYNILAGSDTSTVEAFCRDGTVNRTVQCLEKLYSECRKHEGFVVQPDMWRKSFSDLCDNLTIHAQYSDCIVQQRFYIHSCLKRNDELLDTYLKPWAETQETFTMKMCSYFEGIRICTSQPVSDACHVDAGKYISSFIYGITPNSICENGAIYTVLKSRSSVNSYYGQTLFAEFLFICSFKLCFFE